MRNDPGAWLVPARVMIRSYPDDADELAALQELGIRLVINLHNKPHRADSLERCGIREVHIPVPDFTAPSLDQVDQAIAAIDLALNHNEGVIIHCGAGLGRSGTVAACWLVSTGMTPRRAIARVRKVRPGAIETTAQEQVVHQVRTRQGNRLIAALRGSPRTHQ